MKCGSSGWIGALALALAGCGSQVEERGSTAPGGSASVASGGGGGAAGGASPGGFAAQSSGGSSPVAAGGFAPASAGGSVSSGGVSSGGSSPVACAGGVGGTRASHCAGCDSPVLYDSSGNLRLCGDLLLHRVSDSGCASQLPRASELPATAFGDACHRDVECTAKVQGYCTNLSTGHGGTSGNVCSYGCQTEKDCPSGQICECGDPVGHCITASCKSDADCGPGLLCVATATEGCYGSRIYVCQTPSDECVSRAGCPNGPCTWNGTRFACSAALMCPIS